VIDDAASPPLAICDGCGATGEAVTRETRQGFRAWAWLPDGWRLSGARGAQLHFCPVCPIDGEPAPLPETEDA
jgi:hypothetical protein